MTLSPPSHREYAPEHGKIFYYNILGTIFDRC
jgi:hypothetical protein